MIQPITVFESYATDYLWIFKLTLFLLLFFFFHILFTTSQIGIDRTDLSKAFIQLTLEFLTKQVSFIFSHQFVSSAFEAVLRN